MARRFETNYRLKSGDNLGDPEFWNRRFDDLDRRIDSSEQSLQDVDEVADRIEGVALQRLDQVITPIVVETLERVRDIPSLFSAHSSTSASIEVGRHLFVIDTQQRNTFAHLGYVGIYPTSDADSGMLGRVESFDVVSGEIVINVEGVWGSGTYTSWDITATQSFLAHAGRTDNPHATTAAQTGAYSKSETDSKVNSAVQTAIAELTASKITDASSTGRTLLTGTAAAAAAAIGLTASSMRNRLINGNFSINQRAAPSAATTYPANTYIMDRWRAGAAGATLSFSAAANGDVTVVITAGTLQQVIEGRLSMPEGGTYVLSWTGTAQARVNGGSYASSPLVVNGLAGGANSTVEFGVGTVALAQMEFGSVVTAFERRSDEMQRCRRYFRTSYTPGLAPGTVNAINTATYISRFIDGESSYATLANVVFEVPMRTSPTIILYSARSGASGMAYAFNLETDIPVYVALANASGFTVSVNNTSVQYGVYTAFTASAEF